ncbi:MAG: hypothetical protein AAGK00_11295 [Pseudomonadota bacterium]
MTEAAQPSQAVQPRQQRQSLGLAEIMSDVLVLYLTRFPKMLLLSVPSALAMAGIFWAFFFSYDGWLPALDRQSPFFAAFVVIFGLSLTLGTGLSLAAGPMSMAFRTYRLERRVPLQSCPAQIYRRPVQAAICAIAVTFATMLPLSGLAFIQGSLMALIYGLFAVGIGMYAVGRWGAAVPAVTAEGIGISALGRANRLSQDYRWASAAAAFVLWFTAQLMGGGLAALLNAGVSAFWHLVLDRRMYSQISETLFFITFVVGITLIANLLALGLAALRERLVQIKDPPDVTEFLDVFD